MKPGNTICWLHRVRQKFFFPAGSVKAASLSSSFARGVLRLMPWRGMVSRRWRGCSGAVSESAFIVLAPKKRTGAACQGGTPVRASVRRRRGTARNAAIHNWTAVIRKYLNAQEPARAAMVITNPFLRSLVPMVSPSPSKSTSSPGSTTVRGCHCEQDSH